MKWNYNMKSESTFKEKLDKIISDEKSNWEEKAKWRKANKNWLLKSAAISLKISNLLKERNMTQLELAQKLGSSAQHVSKIIRGQENLTLETISKIELCLGVELISVPEYSISIEVAISDISSKTNSSTQSGFSSAKSFQVQEDQYDVYNGTPDKSSFLQTA